jgi:hypothetical protein
MLELHDSSVLISMTLTSSKAAYDPDAYLERFKESRERMKATMTQTLDWVGRLDVMAATVFTSVEPMTQLFPAYWDSEYCRICYDIHASTKRYGALGVSIKSNRMRTDLGSLSQTELVRLLGKFSTATDAKSHAAEFSRFNQFVKRVSALRFLEVEFLQASRTGPVLPRWFDALQRYGHLCRPRLQDRFNTFLKMSADLDQAMFEFNAVMGRIRFRSIRCSYTIADHDLLGPSSPEMKVVTSIHPLTQHRRYNSMIDFKTDLRRKRVRKALTETLGRTPEKDEVKAAMLKARDKKPNSLITREVIKACCLGRHATQVFEAQENLVAVMQPWTDLREKLQALL